MKRRSKQLKEVNNDRKVNLEKLKYDLNDLFEDTPIFEEPLPQYSDKKLENSWR